MKYAVDAGKLKHGRFVIAFCCMDYPNNRSLVVSAADNNQAEYRALMLCIESCLDATEVVTDSKYAVDKFNAEHPNNVIKVSWIPRGSNPANLIVRGKKEFLKTKS